MKYILIVFLCIPFLSKAQKNGTIKIVKDTFTYKGKIHYGYATKYCDSWTWLKSKIDSHGYTIEDEETGQPKHDTITERHWYLKNKFYYENGKKIVLTPTDLKEIIHEEQREKYIITAIDFCKCLGFNNVATLISLDKKLELTIRFDEDVQVGDTITINQTFYFKGKMIEGRSM